MAIVSANLVQTQTAIEAVRHSKEALPFELLEQSGLLHFINEKALHAYGYALTLDLDEAGVATGFRLDGDGMEAKRHTLQEREAAGDLVIQTLTPHFDGAIGCREFSD